jgi:hypothetical protein
MMELRPAHTRGSVDFGWLKSQHSFSFGNWYDPRYMGFGALRVINEDRVSPGQGFGTHPHRDMEIVSYVVAGELGHEDTMGNGSVIRPGEVQIMSAGTGVAHSEMNASTREPVHFLQIWLLPRQGSTPPRYDQRNFPLEHGLRRIVSPDGADGSIVIGQDADIWRAVLAPGMSAVHAIKRRRAWVQVVRGTARVNDTPLGPGDALALVGEPGVRLEAERDATAGDFEALVFDLA